MIVPVRAWTCRSRSSSRSAMNNNMLWLPSIGRVVFRYAGFMVLCRSDWFLRSTLNPPCGRNRVGGRVSESGLACHGIGQISPGWGNKEDGRGQEHVRRPRAPVRVRRWLRQAVRQPVSAGERPAPPVVAAQSVMRDGAGRIRTIKSASVRRRAGRGRAGAEIRMLEGSPRTAPHGDHFGQRIRTSFSVTTTIHPVSSSRL